MPEFEPFGIEKLEMGLEIIEFPFGQQVFGLAARAVDERTAAWFRREPVWMRGSGAASPPTIQPPAGARQACRPCSPIRSIQPASSASLAQRQAETDADRLTASIIACREGVLIMTEAPSRCDRRGTRYRSSFECNRW